MYPLVCISFSRYSRIFSLSTPTPIERSPSILIPPPVLPSLASCDRFLGSCLLPVPLPRYSPSSPPPTISPHQPFSFALPTPTTPLRTYANAAAVIGTATRALVLLLVFFPRENVCGSGERTRAATHTKGSFSGPCDMCTHARARPILPSFEHRSCAVQRELRKGGGGVLTRFHACLSFGYSGVISIALLKMCISNLPCIFLQDGRDTFSRCSF